MTATPKRLQRVEAILALRDGPDHFASTRQQLAAFSPELQQQYLDALCNAWLGPLERRATRSDKGIRRGPRDWCHPALICEECLNEYSACRIDARYCSNSCRQRAYRRRQRTVRVEAAPAGS
jgi:hypothetical protein